MLMSITMLQASIAKFKINCKKRNEKKKTLYS